MRLDGSDVLSLLELPATLEAEPAPDFETVLTLISTLIPCDSASFNDMTLAAGDFRYAVVPEGDQELARRLKPDYDRYAHQHPLINRTLQDRTTRAIRFCDVPEEPITDTDLYRYFYEPFGVRFQLVVQLPSPPDVVVGNALNRSAEMGEFSDRDVEMLNGWAGYLAMHHRLVMSAGRSRTMADVANGDGWAVLTVRADGLIEASSARSLSPELKTGQRVSAVVADLITTGVDGGTATASHDVTVGGDRWRHVVHPSDVGPTVLLMRRLGDESAEVAPHRDVGLTQRQAEVALELARSGGTNAQLARSLQMSAGTVKRHLEAVFRVLGVDSRGGAVVALRSTGTHDLQS